MQTVEELLRKAEEAHLFAFLFGLGSIVFAVIFNYKSHYYGVDYQCDSFLSRCLVTSRCVQDTLAEDGKPASLSATPSLQ